MRNHDDTFWMDQSDYRIVDIAGTDEEFCAYKEARQDYHDASTEVEWYRSREGMRAVEENIKERLGLFCFLKD